MTGESISPPIHEHSDAWPHDDTHHVVAAFTLLLVERGAATFEELSAGLVRLQVVRGSLDPEGLDRVIANLEQAGLVTSSDAAGTPQNTYALTASGRAFVNDWSTIMRERRRLSRSFLALYDRTDE